ncbi:MAG: anaerobic carbon-monoxide dehydrogenase catalytic subunit [Candidatus Hydrogenedentes bacterium]|nr:anaerobic carbon-monoxide dehydrogenase catalytic subunit [Candidatus Hydrogenedentota bacterium]
MAYDRERNPSQAAFDEASVAMLRKADADGVESDVFSRADEQGAPCIFGSEGRCCRICHMGPCKISDEVRGVCGATLDTVVARNLLRELVAGTAAHSDHGRHLVLLLKDVAEGRNHQYQIRDPGKLRAAAAAWGIPDTTIDTLELARQLAELFIAEFSHQEGKLASLRLAPKPRQGTWDSLGIAPKGIDPSVVEGLHRSNMGVDHDYRNILRGALTTSIADGWGGSMIATTVGDILFGVPSPVRARANLGVLERLKINVVVHGHEPALTEMLVAASRDPEILAEARAVGAEGINLAGICCTANEVLMRHGVPVAGNFLQQELALVTGAVELMITDVQCCMPSLPEVAKCYHTKILTSNPIAQHADAQAVDFSSENAMDCAKAILRKAIENFPNRDPKKVAIPDISQPVVAGFSNETIFNILGGTFRRSFRPLNDAIITGRIRGVCGIVGCTNARRGTADRYLITLARELIRRNVLVLKTGCAAVAAGKAGLLTPEAALRIAGPSLREVCEAIGIPPVLHMGSCVDNSRILMAATYLVEEGGLGNDLSDLPAIGAAPEWMSEKAIAIAHYFVASGIDVVLGHPFRTMGSEKVTSYLCGEIANDVGAKFHYIPDVERAVETICAHLEEKRDALGINRKVERKLFDMKDRRELYV